MLEIRGTKYARQLNLTFFGKRYEDVPSSLGWRLFEGGHKKTHQCRPARRQSAPNMPQLRLHFSLLSCKSDSFTSSKISFFSNGPTNNAELIVAIDWGIRNSSPPDNAARVWVTVFSKLQASCTERKRETIDSTNFFNEWRRERSTSRFDQETSSIFLESLEHALTQCRPLLLLYGELLSDYGLFRWISHRIWTLLWTRALSLSDSSAGHE